MLTNVIGSHIHEICCNGIALCNGIANEIDKLLSIIWFIIHSSYFIFFMPSEGPKYEAVTRLTTLCSLGPMPSYFGHGLHVAPASGFYVLFRLKHRILCLSLGSIFPCLNHKFEIYINIYEKQFEIYMNIYKKKFICNVSLFSI